MREIKFRGKTRKGEWVYGCLVQCVNHASILSLEYVEYNPLDRIAEAVLNNMVEESTIGQYTGLKDKNGKEIYEGDIFAIKGKNSKLIKYQESSASFSCANICELKDERWMNIWWHPDEGWLKEYADEIEVIGNIYDNRELLEDRV